MKSDSIPLQQSCLHIPEMRVVVHAAESVTVRLPVIAHGQRSSVESLGFPA